MLDQYFLEFDYLMANVVTLKIFLICVFFDDF